MHGASEGYAISFRGICHILQNMEVLLRTSMFRGMLKNVSQISKISWCPSPPPLKVIGL
jgi:hypothetical protein